MGGVLEKASGGRKLTDGVEVNTEWQPVSKAGNRLPPTLFTRNQKVVGTDWPEVSQQLRGTDRIIHSQLILITSAV